MLSWDDFEEKEVKPLPQTEIKSPVKEESKKSVSNEETLGVASLDDLDKVVTSKGLNGGYWAIRKAIEAIEKNKYFKVTVLCEPQMSKRNLYPTLSDKNKNKNVKIMMNFLSYCDGKNSLLEIADKIEIPI